MIKPSDTLHNNNHIKADARWIARALTIVENELEGADDLLQGLRFNIHIPVIGITGPPGAGKSTLVDKIIDELAADGKKIAVLAVDPTSPFNFGSLLGDRIRMASHFDQQNVFIRSVATRGSLGGLSAKIIEMTDVLRASGFDYILVETVGVGQSEVEIAGLADITAVVLVPEAGDEIQNIKSGLMEIADIFVVNKADRPEADLFAANLQKITATRGNIPVIKTVATTGEGIRAFTDLLKSQNGLNTGRRELLMTEKAYSLIQQHRMRNVDKKKLRLQLAEALKQDGFNLYAFVKKVNAP